MHGTVKKVNHDKGWGFIRSEGGAEDVFFHRSAVRGQAFELVEEGQRVEFDIGEPREGKGPRAERVHFD